MSQTNPVTVIYLITPVCSSSTAGINRAVSEAGPGGEVVIAYAHDPRHEDSLKEALSSGAFVGLKQVEDVAHAAWESVESVGKDALEEAQKAAEDADITLTLKIIRGPLVEVVRELSSTLQARSLVVTVPAKTAIGRWLLLPRAVRQLRRELTIPVIEVPA